MKTEKLALAVNDIDEELILKAESPAKRRPRYLRYAAAAAALLLIFGAAFGVAKTAGAGSSPIVPDDAVLPPSQMGNGAMEGLATSDRTFNLEEVFTCSDAVCLLTIGNWLGENSVCTYFEASVEKVYKGELPERIVVYQLGTSEWIVDNSPLFVYGDRVLMGLTHREISPYENTYEPVGAQDSYLYAEYARDGHTYLIDYNGVLSYHTEDELPGLGFRNFAYNADIVKGLIDRFSLYDKVVSERLEEYYNENRSDSPMDFPLRIYSLDEVEMFFNGLN